METCQNCQNIGTPECPLPNPVDKDKSPYINYLNQDIQVRAHQIVLGFQENCFKTRYTIP